MKLISDFLIERKTALVQVSLYHTFFLSSIKKLYSLDGEYRVCPGHGDETTLSFERENNPYTRGL